MARISPKYPTSERILDNQTYSDYLNLVFDNESTEYTRLLQQAIQEDLTPTQFKYIKMHYIDGYKLIDVAKKCGVCQSTVSRSIKAAKKKLKLALKYTSKTLLKLAKND